VSGLGSDVSESEPAAGGGLGAGVGLASSGADMVCSGRTGVLLLGFGFHSLAGIF